MSTPPEFDHEIAIVGGGPAGCSAGMFTAREGLDTVIFDRGRSSIQRCAHLENYLGFPDGIDIESFYELIQNHAETAGCSIIPDVVESVDHLDPEAIVAAVDTERLLAAMDDEAVRAYLDGEQSVEAA